MKIALLGYGKMGKTIEEISLKRNHTVLLKTNNIINKSELLNVDIAIDFSTPKAVVDNIKKCFDVNVPVIVGTTGWYNQFENISKLCRKTNNSLFYATNFSVGVNIFFEINKVLARLMDKQQDYAVEMTEIHHTQKIDSPSGTAITLANGIIENIARKTEWSEGEKSEEKLTINAFREGNVPGTHIITYENNIDKLEIKHEAKGRIGFATGAVLAAEWMQHKKGIYTMKDMLQLK